METVPKIESKELGMVSFRNRKILDKDIFPDMQNFVVANPIEPKRVSKFTNNLTVKSTVKAMLVFAGTIGTYYLAKTTGIFSFLGLKEKNQHSKDVVNNEIMEVKNKANVLSIRRNLETTRQVNNPSLNRIEQTYEDTESTVKFEERKVEKFKNLREMEEENEGMRRTFSRRSINIQNPIPDQNVIVGKPFELTIDGTYVFSSSDSLFLEATSIPSWLTFSNPNPTFKGSYNTSNRAFGIAVSGNYAYVADFGISSPGSLQIIDISDPSNPTFKASYNKAYYALKVALFGNYAYVGDWSSGLHIVDISDPLNPTLKGLYNPPGLTYGVTLSGDYAFTADRYSGLHIIDVGNPSNPTLKGSYNTLEDAFGVAVFENYVYVTDLFGLHIIDVTDPSSPTFKGAYNTSDYAMGIALFDNYAYVAAAGSGLHIVDITNPSNPTLKGLYNASDPVYGVTLSGNYAYVVNCWTGLQIIDISDPSNPTFKDSYNTSGCALEVALSENYAYVADGDLGLKIIALNQDKLILSGIPTSMGTYRVDIKACNEIMECATDSFDIIVKDIVDTTDTMSVTDTTDLTNSIVIISSMTVAACVACIASFSLPLIIGAVIVALRRHRNKILGNEDNAKEKELKEIKELKK
jgi:hypothetical protein